MISVGKLPEATYLRFFLEHTMQQEDVKKSAEPAIGTLEEDATCGDPDKV